MERLPIRRFLVILTLLAVVGNGPAQAAQSWSSYLFGNRPANTAEKPPIFNSTKPRQQQAAPAASPGTREEILARVRAAHAPQMHVYSKLRAETRQRLLALRKQQSMDALRRKKGGQAQQVHSQPVAVQAQPPEEKTEKKVIFNRPGVTKPPKVFTDYR